MPSQPSGHATRPGPGGTGFGSIPSVKDVAARASVSLGTVSNVLNRPEQVSEPTRRRVLAAIQELGFVRNEAARRLRGAGSRTLAYVMANAGNPFFTDVARGVQLAADAAGLMLYLCDGGEARERQNAYLDLLEQQRVAGVLVTPVNAPDGHIAALRARGTPVVLIDASGTDARLCSVGVDNVLGGSLAVTHLLDIGHRRIAFCGGPRRIRQIADRIAGAQRAVEAAGNAELIVMDTDTMTVAAGRYAGQRLAELPADRRPTAAVCANDLIALGLLQQTLQLGIRVPVDLAIVGYDDIEFAQAAAVPLTSVRQPRQLLGRTATELMLAETRGDPNHEHQHVLFAPELVVRASTVGQGPA